MLDVTELHQALHKLITSYSFMTEAFLQYSSELSSSRITAATRVRYVNKQLMVYWQLPNLVDHTADPPNLRLEAISPVVVGALLASFVILQITSTFTNSEFVPIWYIWIAVSVIGILCIKQYSRTQLLLLQWWTAKAVTMSWERSKPYSRRS